MFAAGDNVQISGRRTAWQRVRMRPSGYRQGRTPGTRILFLHPVCGQATDLLRSLMSGKSSNQYTIFLVGRGFGWFYWILGG